MKRCGSRWLRRLERIAGAGSAAEPAGRSAGLREAEAPKAAGEPQPRKKRAKEHNTSRKRMVPTHGAACLEHCPDCAYRLTGESLDYSREVIELPPPQPVEVIEHQVVKRWCPHCERGAARSWI
jgi:hypothetical protein